MKFVTFEIAKKLKEKGFKEKCLAHYDCYRVLSPSTYIETWDARNCEDLDYTFFLRSFNEGLLDTIGIVYDAPTIAQVLKWLREEKNIHIEIRLFTCGYGFDIYKIYPKEKIVWSGTLEYETFEQAAIRGIEYTLYNLI